MHEGAPFLGCLIRRRLVFSALDRFWPCANAGILDCSFLLWGIGWDLSTWVLSHKHFLNVFTIVQSQKWTSLHFMAPVDQLILHDVGPAVGSSLCTGTNSHMLGILLEFFGPFLKFHRTRQLRFCDEQCVVTLHLLDI